MKILYYIEFFIKYFISIDKISKKIIYFREIIEPFSKGYTKRVKYNSLEIVN